MGNPETRSERRSALELAAQTASTSYRESMSAAELRDILSSESVPPALRPHLYALLDEAPASLLHEVAEELGEAQGKARVWGTMRKIARQLKSNRDLWT